MSLRASVGIAFLAVQAALVAFGVLGGNRSFSWAPHTTQIHYQIHATVDDRLLSPDEVNRRFHVAQDGWEAHDIRNVQAIVTQYARTYGRHEAIRVSLRYRINGGPEQFWQWPSP
jgi:hypothetical protein